MSHAVFLIDLNQDVAALRPVASFFRRESDLALAFVYSKDFLRSDATGIWLAELTEIARDLGAQTARADTVADVMRALDGKSGMLLSASESALNEHRFNHTVFLAAPPGFVRVTLQHGLECIGFNHNRAHDATWWNFIGLGCDIAVSWFEIDKLHSLRPDQRAKLLAAGPPIALNHPPVIRTPRPASMKPAYHGLVCENLHSVRFSADNRSSFVDGLTAFADALARFGGTVDVRPHPGGRYVEKSRIDLPANVRLNRLPLYKQSLQTFEFCISGPSSVLLDLVWAGVPVAVWTSGRRDLDIGAYAGLHVVSNPSEWIDFALAAATDPTPFLAAQRAYLANLRFPEDAAARYRELTTLAASAGISRQAYRRRM